MAMKLDGPIPGQSLTQEPGNQPWEQPPMYAEAEKALAFHMQKLNVPEILDETMDVLESGMPLQIFVESLLTMGVMEGYHTIDVSMLIGPVIHEFLKTMAESQDIIVNEWDGPSSQDREKERQKNKMKMMIGKGISSPAPMEAPQENVSPEMSPQAAVPQEPKGLINRRA